MNNEINVRPSSLIANFAPLVTSAQQSVTTTITTNKMAASLEKLVLQGSSVFPDGLAQFLTENPEIECYVKVTFTKDEFQAGRGKKAIMPVVLPTDTASYDIAGLPDDLKAKVMAFAGKRANMPANEQLKTDCAAYDYKTGSNVWYRYMGLQSGESTYIPFFRYEQKA